MTNSLREVALLLLQALESSLAGRREALDELRESLAAEGVGEETVQGALAWLRVGVSGEAEELVPAVRAGELARRVLSLEERRLLSPEAYGFLLGLAADGRLADEQLESILARLGENELPLDLNDVQELAWRVTTGEPESETDLGPTQSTIH